MAIKLKTGKEYSDRFGNKYTDAYSVIDWVCTDKTSLYHKFKIRTFKNKQARIDKLEPIEVKEFCCSGIDFEPNFGVEKTQNAYELSYNYVMSLEDIKTEEVKGKEVKVTTKIFEDWESDE